MRIVCIADTHLFVEDLPAIPDGDLLIHAGDFCRAGSLEELTEAMAWFSAFPHRHKVCIGGNHDRAFEDQPAEARTLVPNGVVYLEDSAVEIEGLRIWGSPWQPAFNEWAFNLFRGQPLAEKWALIPEDTDILVTHGPPAGYGDRSPYKERAGCVDLLQACRRVAPLLHVYGHIHNDGGYWVEDGVAFANVTTWECERPASVFDLDLATRRVTPVQVPGADKTRFSAPKRPQRR